MALDNIEIDVETIRAAANSPNNYKSMENVPPGNYIVGLKKIVFKTQEETGREYLEKHFVITDEPENPEKYHGRPVISFENIYVRNSKDGNKTAIQILMRKLNGLIPAYWKAGDRGEFVETTGFKFNQLKDLPAQHEAVVKKYGIEGETPARYEIKVTPSGAKNIEVAVVNGYVA